MINGRAVSPENVWALKQNLTRLYMKQVRISQQIKELNTLIGEYEPTDSQCWSCKRTNRDTTDLTLCELGNTLYPLACDEFEVKEK